MSEYLGYKFTSRTETAEEYRSRTGSGAGAGALIESGSHRVRAGFAEHHARLRGVAEVDVAGGEAPDRAEAERLAWPAVLDETERSLGPGDWHPSLEWLETVRLLGEAPAVEPARLGEGFRRVLRDRPWMLTDAYRMSVAAFAERYARSRRLHYEAAGATPASPWFMASLNGRRSHSFVTGRLGGGAVGRLWYGERIIRAGSGAARESWTVAYYLAPWAGPRGSGIACVPRHSPGRGGRDRPVSQLPAGLIAVDAGDEAFGRRYEVGVVDEASRGLAARLFTPGFSDWLAGQPYGKLGADAALFEARAGALCVYTRGALHTAEELDAFCERAARIYAELERSARPVVG